MKIKLTVFARLSDFFDRERELELPSGARISDAMELLAAEVPAARPVLDSCRAALGETFVELDTPLEAGAELFLLPPSSGG